MLLDSPWWRIAAATGEEPEAVLQNLAELGLLGYDADEIWTLLRGAINAQITTADLLAQVGPKEPD